jgi:hypothetical protein
MHFHRSSRFYQRRVTPEDIVVTQNAHSFGPGQGSSEMFL